MEISLDDKPRSLRDADIIQRRNTMLSLEHMVPLKLYVDELRQRNNKFVPYFDPLDGGVRARLLFLYQKPGNKTAPSMKGSGFVSRNNDDFGAEKTFEFMQQAGIPRHETITWNVIPWWNQTAAVEIGEVQEGKKEIPKLLKLLPDIQAVVLVGGEAQKAREEFVQFNIFESALPSSKVRNIYKKKWDQIPLIWESAARSLT